MQQKTPIAISINIMRQYEKKCKTGETDHSEAEFHYTVEMFQVLKHKVPLEETDSVVSDSATAFSEHGWQKWSAQNRLSSYVALSSVITPTDAAESPRWTNVCAWGRMVPQCCYLILLLFF